MEKLVSVDLKADFGFLKKPDINESVYLTYNMLHKPMLLGVFGAVLGLDGYAVEGNMQPDEVPEYRAKLNSLKIAIEPISINGEKSYGAQGGNFTKEIIRYTNTVGYANKDGTLIINEQTLYKPAYRIYVLVDNNKMASKLVDSLEKREATYIPYLGKNEHQVWWENFQEWQGENYKPDGNFKINSIYKKQYHGKTKKKEKGGLLSGTMGTFMYFERLPVGFMDELPQYELEEFVYTDFELTPDNEIPDLLKIKNGQNQEKIIHIF